MNCYLFGLFMFLAHIFTVAVALEDLTLREVQLNSSSFLLQAINSKLRNLIGNDYSFYERTAIVESKYGEDKLSSDNGGIWKIPKDIFQNNKTSTILYTKIQNQFNINWTTVSYGDLQKPLYSALAMMLAVGQQTELPSSLNSQGLLWATTLGRLKDVSSFVKIVTEYEKQPKYGDPQCQFNLVLLLDGSRSIGLPDYDNSKIIVADLLQSIITAGYLMQMGFTVFSTNSIVEFPLINNLKLVEMKQVITSAAYPGGSTATDVGISAAMQQFMNTKSIETNIIVLFTDGKSNNPTLTLASAETAKKQGVKIISIGIGSGINTDEPTSVSSLGQALKVKAYSELPGIMNILKKMACSTPHDGTAGSIENQLQFGQISYYFILVDEQGSTIRIFTRFGRVAAYYSLEYEHPTEALNDGPVGDGIFVQISTRAKRDTASNDTSVSVKVFVSVLGLDKLSGFNMTTMKGNYTEHLSKISPTTAIPATKTPEEVPAPVVQAPVVTSEIEPQITPPEPHNEPDVPDPCSPTNGWTTGWNIIKCGIRRHFSKK